MYKITWRLSKQFKFEYFLKNKNYTKNEIYSIEREVNQIYYVEIRKQCLQEEYEISRLKSIARNTRDKKYKEQIIQRIKSMDLANCELMSNLRKNMGYN
jgi:hypothetical protein